jgi:hypothetical protein
MAAGRNAYKTLVGKYKGKKRPLVRLSFRLKIKEILCGLD